MCKLVPRSRMIYNVKVFPSLVPTSGWVRCGLIFFQQVFVLAEALASIIVRRVKMVAPKTIIHLSISVPRALSRNVIATS